MATAGQDTTSYALSGGLEQLLRHPDHLQALRDDPELMTDAAEEILRWTTPVRSFFRWTQADHELGAVTIPEGDVVLTCYPSANRDEAVFVASAAAVDSWLCVGVRSRVGWTAWWLRSRPKG